MPGRVGQIAEGITDPAIIFRKGIGAR